MFPLIARLAYLVLTVHCFKFFSLSILCVELDSAGLGFVSFLFWRFQGNERFLAQITSLMKGRLPSVFSFSLTFGASISRTHIVGASGLSERHYEKVHKFTIICTMHDHYRKWPTNVETNREIGWKNLKISENSLRVTEQQKIKKFVSSQQLSKVELPP